MDDLIQPWGHEIASTTVCGRGGSLEVELPPSRTRGRLAIRAFTMRIALHRIGDNTHTRVSGQLQVIVRGIPDIDLLVAARAIQVPVDLALSVYGGTYRFSAMIGDPEGDRDGPPCVIVDFEGTGQFSMTTSPA